MNAKEYALQAHGSFALPDACFKVKQLMDTKTSSAEDFANVISLDPSMASRLLQLANSAIYNLRSEVSTISRAITLIGTQALYNMMLIDVATTAFKHFSSPSINLKQFWLNSIFAGLVSKNLAIKAGIRDIERMFVVGLLHDFGGLIVAKMTPEAAKRCESISPPAYPWQLQTHLLGFSYSQVTAELLELWQLPEKIIIPIRYFTQADHIETNQDIKVLSIAVGLMLANNQPEYLNYLIKDHQHILDDLGIELSDLEEVCMIANQEMSSVVTSMRLKLY